MWELGILGRPEGVTTSAWVSYFLVTVIGLIMGISEIVSTFPNTPIQAFKNIWAPTLVALNGAVAPLLLWVINQFSPQTANSILTTLAVGLGLPTLMRTKFTVAKRLVGGEGN